MTDVETGLVSPQAPGPSDPGTSIGICLSGGGYRAMLFHVGVLWRLAELGYLGTTNRDGKFGPLGSLNRVSSVSGGSITSAMLGLAWHELRVDQAGIADRYKMLVADRIQSFASKTTVSIASGILAMIFSSVNKHVANYYRKHLYGSATLQDFPDSPQFIVNATNLQSGALWRFSKVRSADYRVGEILAPTDSLARVVGASSAFPPLLSPARFRYSESLYSEENLSDRHYPPYTTKPLLCDGGVYDNLGLETVFKHCKTLIVSNAGGGYSTVENVPANWFQQSLRVMSTTDNQVRSLRKRTLLTSLINKERYGAYFSIRSNIAHYPVAEKLDCPIEKTQKLANLKTDLSAKSQAVQRKLINWGYAICDAGVRSWAEDGLDAPTDFPYPEDGV